MAPQRHEAISMRDNYIISVDTEAQPDRASENHIDRLIYGERDGDSLGIFKMMDIADQHNAKLVFFLDYAEYHKYGEAILDVGREISNRGHDVQLHIHPEFIPATFYAKANTVGAQKFSTMEQGAADVLADHILELHERATGLPALAFRGGGYRYSRTILDALRARGVKYTSNENAAKTVSLIPSKSRGPFIWSNGLFEIPVSTIKGFMGLDRDVPLNFNAGYLSNPRYALEECVTRHSNFLKTYTDTFPEGIAMMVMHSWSFFNKDADGYRSVPDEHAPERLNRIIADIRQTHNIVSFTQLDADLDTADWLERLETIPLPQTSQAHPT